jgi:hypothetical protein
MPGKIEASSTGSKERYQVVLIDPIPAYPNTSDKRVTTVKRNAPWENLQPIRQLPRKLSTYATIRKAWGRDKTES